MIARKENLDDLANHWAIEQEHVTRLLWGEINLHAILDVIFKISKYLMGTDARVITTSNLTKILAITKRRIWVKNV